MEDTSKNVVDNTPDGLKIVLPDAGDANSNINSGDGKDNVIDLTKDTTELTIGDVKYNVNKDGNAIDDKGQIVKSKADLDALSASTNTTVEDVVDIDGKQYKIDKDGNALNPDNTIFKSKTELDQLEASSSIINDIQKATGIVLTDDKGQPIQYEDTPEGLASYVRDAAEYRAAEQYNQAQEQFFNANPEILDILRYKQTHGTIEGYAPEPDYTSLIIDKDNEGQQEQLIIAARMKKGDTIDEAKRFVQYSKDDTKLYDDAVNAKEYLVNVRKQETAQYEAQVAAQRQEQELAERNYWNTVYNKVVKENKLVLGEDNVIALPKVIRVKDTEGKVINKTPEDFYTFLNVPVPVNLGNRVVNMTGYQIAQEIERSQRTVDHDIFDALRLFSGGDTSQFIKQAIQQEKVRTLKTYFTKHQNKDNSITENTNVNTGAIVMPIK